MRARISLLCLLLLILGGLILPAQASTVYTFQFANSGKFTKPAGNGFGTITFVQNSSTSLTVNVQLASGFTFAKNGTVFGFDLASITGESITNVSTGFSGAFGSATFDGFGTYNGVISNTSGSATLTSLSFTISGTQTITPLSFVSPHSVGGTPVYFAAQLPNGGFIAAKIPEPSTLPLLGLGLVFGLVVTHRISKQEC